MLGSRCDGARSFSGRGLARPREGAYNKLMPAAATSTKIQSAEKLARAAIARHCPGWGFGWVEDQARATGRTQGGARRETRGLDVRRTLGRCDFERREIQLSRYHVLASAPARIWETILHEIAHACASEQGDSGHGQIWAHFCYKLGIGAHAEAHRALLGVEG